MTKTWIPTTTTQIVSEIQRLAKTYLNKKYTQQELLDKYQLGVNYYKNLCKQKGVKVDSGIAKQRGNKVLYAILDTIKQQIRKSQSNTNQISLF